jgi:hypothetical protein
MSSAEIPNSNPDLSRVMTKMVVIFSRQSNSSYTETLNSLFSLSVKS